MSADAGLDIGKTRGDTCECGNVEPHTGHCACCSCPVSRALWCPRCSAHVGPANLPPWERTWFGQYGEDCPYE